MYSFWSGEVQGIQENMMEAFEKEQTFSNALLMLLAVRAMRSDFKRYRRMNMIEGDLLPFDKRLVKNIFVGAKNSTKRKVFRERQ